MKKIVNISGLDCPNCARNLEKELKKIDGIESLSLDFNKSIICYESAAKDSLSKIKKVAKQVEPNVKISEQKLKGQVFGKAFFIDLTTLLLGLAVGLCALFCSVPTWAFWILFVTSALLLGYKTYYKAIVLLFKGVINENLLLTISVIGATALGEYMEGLMVIFLYSIGKLFEGIALNKSRQSIAKLTSLQPDSAILIDEEGNERTVSPKDVQIGQVIKVRPGDRVALDGVVISGNASLDTQSLTGESLPRHILEGEEVLSGSIVLDGVLLIRTTKLEKDSTSSKILQLIENASQNKSKTETFISKITKWYTLGVIVLSVLVWGIVWAVTKNIDTAIYRGLIFLVVSCPCAFAISVPLAYFSGLGNASRRGILVKGSNYLDESAKISLVAFDKTGTLTSGQFKVTEIECFDSKLENQDIIYYASLGEQNSNHPLASAILRENKRELKQIESFKEIAGSGVAFEFEDHRFFVGRKDNSICGTIVEVYRDDERIGIIHCQDEIKPSAMQAIEKLNELGIKSVVLSGDNKETVEKVAQKLNIDYRYQLLPQDKYNFIEQAKKEQTVGYVGDGINDAPSLVLANVGISMGINGNGASKEASAVVLANDDPEKVATLVKIARKTRYIVLEDIVFSFGVKLLFLLLGSLGVTGMALAVFADVGVTLIAILNSLRALMYNPDKTRKSKKREKLTPRKEEKLIVE